MPLADEGCHRQYHKGFILYSVGADGKDDGGKVAVRPGQEVPIPPLSSRETGSDIVWVCRR